MYLPIIGSGALSLYQYLYFAPEELRVSGIVQLLNLNLSTFEKARAYLEGIQLLKTFEGENYFVLAPIAPLTAEDFLQQPALVSLLKSSTDEEYLTSFQKNKRSEAEITKQFGEVYIEPTKESTPLQKHASADFTFKAGVEAEQTIDIKDLTANEQKMIGIVPMLEPQDFLATFKHQNKSYVADDEFFIVEKLKKERKISNELINMVIYLSLGREKQPKLVQNYVDTVVLDWLQNNVKTALGAMQRIKAKTDQKNARRSGRAVKQTTTVGQIPKWASQKFEEKVSEEDMAAIEARFDKLNT
jgi:replication initiation and membrane attachment protein DnaB